MIEETKIEATPIHSFFSKLFSKLSSMKKKSEESTLPTSPFKSSISEYERIFSLYDKDGDGKITPTELIRKCMKTVGEDISEEDAEVVVLYADSDGDGLLGFEDFMKLVEVQEEEEKGRNLKKAFGVYEMDGHDCITPKSLRRALEKLGQRKSMEECEMMVRSFDLDGDGVISFDEFRVMML